MSGEELRSIWRWQITLFAALLLLVIALLGISFGPIHIPFTSILRSFLGMDSHLSEQDRSVLFDIRLPRVILAALVGSALATSGAVYQTVFRNPLADPYLLGAAAGAGLGATIAITNSHGNLYGLLPAFAFSGAILAVVVSFFISGKFFAEPNSLYSWILGELTAASWQVVTWSAIYIGVALIILLIVAKQLDGLMLTDEEAYSLGINPNKIRVIAVIAATLATATAVAASGLIGFVGIVVPHLVRGLTHRVTNRALPTIAITGAAFLVLADLGARTLLSPAELPIGIITAFVGAPFFLFVLRRKRLINQ